MGILKALLGYDISSPRQLDPQGRAKGSRWYLGELEGEIIKEKKGDKGFGYDPIFKIKNSCQTLAEVSFEERMKISHRAKSTQEMLKHLNQLYK